MIQKFVGTATTYLFDKNSVEEMERVLSFAGPDPFGNPRILIKPGEITILDLSEVPL